MKATRPARQKVVVMRTALVAGFEGALNREASDGWRLHEVANMVILKGGGMFLGGRGYYFDPNVAVMVRTRKKLRYRCQMLKSANIAEKDSDAINGEITRQNTEGFDLVQVLPLSVISADPERRSKGTQAFMLIFESGVGKSGSQERGRSV